MAGAKDGCPDRPALLALDNNLPSWMLTELCVLPVDRLKQLQPRLVEEQRPEGASIRQRHLQQPDAECKAPHRRKHLDQALLSQDEFQQVSPIILIERGQATWSCEWCVAAIFLAVNAHNFRHLHGRNWRASFSECGRFFPFREPLICAGAVPPTRLFELLLLFQFSFLILYFYLL